MAAPERVALKLDEQAVARQVFGKRAVATWPCLLMLLLAAMPAAGASGQRAASAVQKSAEHANPSKKPASAEVSTLRDALNAQQRQIQMLRDEMARRDAVLQHLHSQLDSIRAATPTAPRLSRLAIANQEQAAGIADLQRQAAELQGFLRQLAGDSEPETNPH